MRKIKDILRLRHEVKLSYRDIAQALSIGYGTVVDYLKRAEVAGLVWPIPEELGERELGRLLFPTQAVTGQRRFTEPDYLTIHEELKKKGVTKQLLWQEYRQLHPHDGYSKVWMLHASLSVEFFGTAAKPISIAFGPSISMGRGKASY